MSTTKSPSHVSILLSTYNGGRWLPTQLDSLLRQTHDDWTLWVRDDASLDGTVEILSEYARHDPRIRLLEADKDHIGPQRSFFRLMESAAADAPYVMFCDQDDVWHADKIAITLDAMRGAEAKLGPETPILVHTDMRLVDQHLGVLKDSAKRHLGFTSITGDVFPRLLAQNFVTGCTLMINRSLADKSTPLPEKVLMHDWWLALVAAALGKIVYVDRATVDYRQHSGNASGNNVRRVPLVQGLLRLLSKPAHFDQLMRGRFAQCLALEEHLARFPPTAAHKTLQHFHGHVRKGRRGALYSAFKHRIAMQGLTRNFLYYFLLAKERYLEPLP